MADSTPSFYSDVPISVPVVLPSAEDQDMNGFSWSHRFGLLVKMNKDGDPIGDFLQSLRQTQRRLGKGNQ